MAAGTHTAVDTLLRRIERILPAFVRHTTEAGYTLPRVRLGKIHSSQPEAGSGGEIVNLPANPVAERQAWSRQPGGFQAWRS